VATAGILVVVVAACAPVYVQQRGPYAKNDSDWAEVSAAMAAHARPGDAVVFDERARPSQRPRLAMRTYPAGFADVRDVTLQIPYDRNIGWADRAYSVPRAAAHGRFDGVRRVWLLELVIDGEQHTYGLADLRALGFQETGVRVSTHRTVLIELTR
jgi:mannosyltransferase